MAGKGLRVPERWTDYIPLGRRMPGTRFIAFKVPLKMSFNRNLHPDERFSPHDLIKKIKEQKEELGLIIDLTYTTRYYRPEMLPDTLCYSKILTMGREIPNKDTIFQFKCVVKQFLNANKDNDKLIGVHCTHGLNRTGYLVCRSSSKAKKKHRQSAVRAQEEHPEVTEEPVVTKARQVCKSAARNCLVSTPADEWHNGLCFSSSNSHLCPSQETQPAKKRRRRRKKPALTE